MIKKTDVKRVSKLRFSDFDDEWEVVSLETLAKVIDCKHRTPPYIEIGVPVISPGTIKWGEIDLKSPTKRVAESEYNSLMDHCSPGCGDLVFSRNQSIGVASFLSKREKFVLGQDTVLIQAKKVDPVFLYFRVQTYAVQSLISKLSGGSTFSRINLNDIRKLKMEVVPSKKEQQKIASFLSAVDQKIQQLTRKKELLEQYKRGVMQKIFSREIRFKDENGKDYPDWEEKRLGDVLTFISTNSFSRNDLNYKSGEIKNIHYGDIHTTFKMGFDSAKEKVPYVNRTIDLQKLTDEQFCQVGDLVIADASEDYNDIGKAIEMWNVSGEKIVAGLHTFLGRDMTGQTSNGFKGYLLQTSAVRKQIQTIAQGISVLGISKGNLAKIQIQLPCKEEQMKIATLLKNLDRKIEATENQLSQTQTFKKGLLQQMFV